MDNVAATGFAAGADAYQNARPSWPLEAVDCAFEDWQIDPSGGLVIDLAAGTGRLTAQLARRCQQLLAIEPVAEMRAHIRGVPAVAGTAEQLPLDDSSAQAMFVAEAFHWFDYPAALAEAARVLRRGGGLAVMWNHALSNDDQTPVRAALTELIRPHLYHPKTVRWLERDARTDESWRMGPGWEAFEPLSNREFVHEQDATRQTLVSLVGSWSFIAALDEQTRTDLLRRVDELLRAHGVERYRQRWRCDLFLTRRR
ncbi:MAG TPA: class I SAM-dependent methyltransferase [Solirubrobacteraceae bacterium]|nr:class I SAM-dependent methyltransferase [Solirubrobacteraceae bacterium]